MIRPLKKLIGALSILVILIYPNVSLASNLQQKLTQSQQKYNDLNSQLTQQRQQESAAAARVSSLQQTIKNLNAAISDQKANIARHEKELQALDQKQKALDTRKEELIAQLSAYVRTNYEQGPLTYLDVLLGANSWTDLMDKVEQVGYVVRHYSQLQTDIKEVTKQIEGQKEAVKQKSAELQAALQQQQVTQQAVQQSVQKENESLSQLSAQEKATNRAKSQAQADIDYIQVLIRQEAIDAENAKREPMPGGSGGGVSAPVQVSAQVSEILAYAQSFIGVPYRWGGTSPSGFDCSGYVQYVFAHFGVNLARISFDQFREGIPVASSDLRPADIVFFSTYASGASHVGIYLGNDYIIDAQPKGIAVARLFGNQYYAPRFVGARRVIKG